MKILTLSKERFTNILVNIMFEGDKCAIHPHSLFMQELVKISDKNGITLRKDCRTMGKEILKMSDDLIRMTLFKLKKDKHIALKGVVIYLHPKYIAVKDCEGQLLITSK